jgi:hypothetical protein
MQTRPRMSLRIPRQSNWKKGAADNASKRCEGNSSTQVLDFEQVRSFKLQPVRQIIYGGALCILAALLAVEAKVAWTASADGAPNDLTAVKLCPTPGKCIHPIIQVASPDTLSPITASELAATYLITFASKWSSGPVAKRRDTQRLAELSFFSPPLFLRPPPAR